MKKFAYGIISILCFSLLIGLFITIDKVTLTGFAGLLVGILGAPYFLILWATANKK